MPWDGEGRENWALKLCVKSSQPPLLQIEAECQQTHSFFTVPLPFPVDSSYKGNPWSSEKVIWDQRRKIQCFPFNFASDNCCARRDG